MAQGIERFKKVAAAAQGGVLNGEDVFQLWDTFGFPVDLTELMAQEQGLKVDKEGEAEGREREASVMYEQSDPTFFFSYSCDDCGL